MSGDSPVHVEVTSPARFDRVQLLLRIALAIVLGWVGITAGWLVCVLYVALPVIAAIAISTQGPPYPAEVRAPLWRVLAWLLRFGAYMGLVVDRFPVDPDDDARVRLTIRFTGAPTAGSALLRLLTSIPSAFVLSLLWFVSGILWFVSALLVLVTARIPESILAFQRGVLRWNARLVAYHASLVEEYPPFTLDGHADRGAALAASAP